MAHVEHFKFFSFTWSSSEEETNEGKRCIIRAYGWNEKLESTDLVIEQFLLPVIIELDENVPWTPGAVNIIKNRLQQLNSKRDMQPVRIDFEERQRLYYAYVDKLKSPDPKTGHKYRHKHFPYLVAWFHSNSACSSFAATLARRELDVVGIGKVRLRCHGTERKITPVLKFLGIRELPSAGWMKGAGMKASKEEQESTRKHEYFVNFQDLVAMTEEEAMKMPIPQPKILCFDNEANSTYMNSMPKPHRPGDKTFQIGYTMLDPPAAGRKKAYRKYLISMGNPNDIEGTTIFRVKTEADVYTTFTQKMREEDPEIILGFNILGWDINYMIQRCKTFCRCYGEFDLMGCIIGKHAEKAEINWSSSGAGKNKFEYLEVEGRVFIDLLPYIKRNYKLDNYRLATCCEQLLKTSNKDDLKPKDIFKAWRKHLAAVDNPKDKQLQAEASSELGRVGKYCVQDSWVTLLLYEKLSVWADLTESATVCQVPMFYMFTEGQQIKMYSQVYRYGFHNKITVESNGYVAKDDEHYTGAYVTEPKKGLYRKIVPFDFAGLYPSIMMAHNIDHSKLVVDPSIPDEDCWVMTWSEHQYCLAEGTMVATANGVSIPIEQFDQMRNVLADDQKSGIVPGKQTHFYDRGTKDCVELILEDGSKLECTGDHKILLENQKWCEASKIPLGTRVRTSVRQPITNPKISMIPKSEWCVNVKYENRELCLSLDTHEQYDKTLAFMRLFGLLLTDGSISYTRKPSWRASVFVGHQIDIDAVLSDIQLLVGKVNPPRRQKYCWTITVPTELAGFYISLGYPVGNKVYQPSNIPSFLQDPNCPVAVIREFLGGLFGGDGMTPSYNKAFGNFSGVGFIQTKTDKLLDNLKEYLGTIRGLLSRFGDYSSGKMHAKKYDGKTTLTMRLEVPETVKFATQIGFRYSCHKSQRLTIAASYLDFRDHAFEQRVWVLNRLKELRRSGFLPNGKTRFTLPKAVPLVHAELRAKEPIFHEYYSLPDYEACAHCLKPSAKNSCVRSSFRRNKFPSAEQYMRDTGTWESFAHDEQEYGEHVYGVDFSATALPPINLKVIFVRQIGPRHVYDLTVENHHNFVAGNIVVHNCNCPLDEFPGQKAPKMKDGSTKRVCASYKYRWLRHDVSGKGVVPTLLEGLISARKKTRKIIAVNAAEIKTLKKIIANEPLSEENFSALKETLKAFTTNKDSNEALQIVQAKFEKGLLLRETPLHTSANISKSSSSPSILTEEEKNKVSERVEQLESLNLVLDRRQNAYKVNANSMYGAMGVRQGYLPFLPGAMCVTYMGRTNIKRVNKFIEEDKKGIVIYNDTDSAYCFFPDFEKKTIQELWAYAKQIVAEVKVLFPPPISLEFEEKVYEKFLILTKKRYAAIAINEDGKIDDKLVKRGIVLQRRDNCRGIRDAYQALIYKIFDQHEELIKFNAEMKLIKEAENIEIASWREKCEQMIRDYAKRNDCEDILDTLLGKFCRKYKIKQKSKPRVMKSKEKTEGEEAEEKPKKKKKAAPKSFDRIEFPSPPERKSRKFAMNNPAVKRLLELITDSIRDLFQWKYSYKHFVITKQITRDVKEYKDPNKLPGHVKLGVRMQKRGIPVGGGTRVEYLILKHGPYKKSETQSEKIEDVNYFAEFREILRIELLSYLKQFINPIDELCVVVMGLENFVKDQFEIRIAHSQMTDQIAELHKTKIKFIEPKKLMFTDK